MLSTQQKAAQLRAAGEIGRLRGLDFFRRVTFFDSKASFRHSVRCRYLLDGIGFVIGQNVLTARAVFLIDIVPVVVTGWKRIIQAFCFAIGILATLMDFATINIAAIVAVFDKNNNPTANGVLSMVPARSLCENRSHFVYPSFLSILTCIFMSLQGLYLTCLFMSRGFGTNIENSQKLI
jgi:hypothetical protein